MNRLTAAALLSPFFLASAAHANMACDSNGPLTIISATDDGLFEETHGPENTIDGDLDADSRWSNESQGSPKSLILDLGAAQTVKGLSIAWHKGDERKAEFTVDASVDGSAYQNIIPTRQSGGSTLDLEPYTFDETKAQFIKITANGNESNDWNSMVEVVASGCGVAVEKPDQPVITEAKGKGVNGLHLDKPPGENFDLLGWYITTPADDDGDGKADSVYENELAAGWTDPRYFYTDPATGGMVFRSTPAGAKTSKNTKYTRTELRGMLRRGDYSIETRVDGGYPNKNNWVLSSQPLSAQAKSAGVDGVLKATLAVNQVTRQGKAYQVGRVTIGQIHAKNDEPIRLYYRKLPRNKYGSIYFAHDPEVGKERWVEVIGSRSDKAKNPEDGIALDETFSYEIETKGVKEGDKVIPMLYLKIIRDDGTEVVAEPFDMRDSGFNVEDEFMFFKAGAYSGNNTSPTPETDFDKVIFYNLEQSYGPVPEGVADATPKPAAPAAAPAQAGVLFDDNFADGGRDNGADATDTNWWHTTNSASLEIAEGHLGLVSGGSGRGLRTTFPGQTLSTGQMIKATFTFTTPDTIGENRDSAFRIGMYDKLGRADLESDQAASSKQPNTNYDGLPGYMIDFDINLKNADKANIDIRRHVLDSTHGRLLGTTKGYKRIGGGGDAYQFAANQTYTGSMTIVKLDNGIAVAGSLSQDGKILSEYIQIDNGSDVNNIGMLAFHVNSKTFGSSKKKDEPDNGIDFKSVKVEVLGESAEATAAASTATETTAAASTATEAPAAATAAEAPAAASAATASTSSAGIVFDDSFADGGRDDGADASDTNWWQTTNSSALEIAPNSLGLVSGGSGRGLRTTFAPQALADGQALQASFTFTTPASIGENRDSAFRIGLYDKLERAELEGDLSASSKKPNTNYDGLPGYMIDFDINLKDPTKANIDIRKHKEATHGRLLGTTKGYKRLGGGGDAYQFAAEQTYTGMMTVQKVEAGVQISGSLSQDGKVLSEFSLTDEGSDVNNFGMLAFHVNSKTFGSSKKKGEPDNGIDFSNVKVEVLP